MKDKTIKEPKDKIIIDRELHNTEGVKIGEITLWSEVIPASELLQCVLNALKNKDVKDYLGFCEKKKFGGTFVG